MYTKKEISRLYPGSADPSEMRYVNARERVMSLLAIAPEMIIDLLESGLVRNISSVSALDERWLVIRSIDGVTTLTWSPERDRYLVRLYGYGGFDLIEVYGIGQAVALFRASTKADDLAIKRLLA